VSYFVGLDLAQASDFTALAVLCRSGSNYDLVQLSRSRGLPYVGTPAWPGLVERLKAYFLTETRLHGCHAAADRTGVGRAVVDALRAAGLPWCLWGVTVTSGQQAARDRLDWTVPKKDLVGVAQGLLSSGRLRLEASLPLAETLRQELKNFAVKVTLAGNETFAAWREGQHDDLVFAVALGCWLGETGVRGTPADIRSGGGVNADSGPSPFAARRPDVRNVRW
jgi:hypothetical protein